MTNLMDQSEAAYDRAESIKSLLKFYRIKNILMLRFS